MDAGKTAAGSGHAVARAVCASMMYHLLSLLECLRPINLISGPQTLLGVDRHWNRYWLLSGPRARARRQSARVPIVCVETQAAKVAPFPAAGATRVLLCDFL